MDAIAEVFPKNELASWVQKAYDSYSIVKIEFCDEEITYERLNWSFDNRYLRKMRSLDNKLQVLNCYAR